MDKGYSLFKRRSAGRTATWYVLIWEGDKRKAYTTRCSKKEDAEAYAEKHFKKGRSPTLSDFVAERCFFVRGQCRWLQRTEDHGRSITENTLLFYRAGMKKLLEGFGDKRLTEISRKDMEQWLIGLQVAPKTKNSILGVARLLWNEAKFDDLLSENMVLDLKPYKTSGAARGHFSLGELATMFPLDTDAMYRIWGNQLKATMFLLVASTGIRNAEVRGLAWRHYLQAERALMVEQQVQHGAITRTKAKRDRIVLLPDRTVAALDSFRAASLYNRDNDFMFANYNGKPHGPRALGEWLPPALKRAGIEAKGRVLCPHSFRHTYVTAVRRQVDAVSFGQMIGHSDAKTTDGYDAPDVHQRIQALEGARKGIAGILPEKVGP